MGFISIITGLYVARVLSTASFSSYWFKHLFFIHCNQEQKLRNPGFKAHSASLYYFLPSFLHDLSQLLVINNDIRLKKLY